MELTTGQQSRYDEIISRWIAYANSFEKDQSLWFQASDAWPSECEVLSITTHTIGLLDQTETWVLSWGTGDDGGPTLIIALWQKLVTEEDDAYQINLMAHHFDTMTSVIYCRPS